jgi:3-deoxy-D-manno-octulosonic-acid transferase
LLLAAPARPRPLMYLLYSLVYSLGLMVMAPYYLWRQRGRMGSHALRERFGFLPAELHQNSSGAIWIHAVSVGETMAIANLVHEIARRFPQKKIFLSHVTPAGREAGEKRIPEVSGRFYLPFDWAWSVRRTLCTIRPSVLIIVETELWPNLLRCAKEYRAHVALVNARVSDRSFGRYRALRPLLRYALDNLECVCAQTARDAERFKEIGMKPDRVAVTGNLKFDAASAPEAEFAGTLRNALAAAGQGPVLIAASTMPREEDLVLGAWQAVRARFPKALLVLAPRHTARFEEVENLLKAKSFTGVRRSSFAPGARALADALSSADVLLLDTIGELAGLFGIADVVFMGGSLVPTGGHNFLEPAFWAKPILFGPHMHNFRDVTELFLGENAALQVSNAEELSQIVSALFADEKRRLELGERARQVLDAQAGSTERTLDRIKPWIEAGGSGKVRSRAT